MSNFEPWSKYPDLSHERLSALANIIRSVRREAVTRHEPQTPGENHHQPLCLSIEGFRPIERILRLAVEVDETTREVSAVTVVEVDDADNVTGIFGIPFNELTSTVLPIQVKPVDLPPPTVEPLQPSGEEHKKAR